MFTRPRVVQYYLLTLHFLHDAPLTLQNPRSSSFNTRTSRTSATSTSSPILTALA